MADIFCQQLSKQVVHRIIVQNGNAYIEGVGPQWDETRDYWENPTEQKKKNVAAFLSEDGIRMQYAKICI